MAFVTRRSFLIVPPAAAAAALLSGPGREVESLNAPALAGVLRADGSPVRGFRQEHLKGWVTLVHALASWRPECADEIALLHEVATDTRVQIAGVFVRDTEADARAFIARHGNPYLALAFDADGRAEKCLAVREVPSTYVFGPGGHVIHVLRGPLTRQYFEETMLPIIEAASPLTELMASRAVTRA